MDNLYALILAGGKGTRLWPKSNLGCPKHSLSLASRFSLLQETVSRIKGVIPPRNILIITTRGQEEFVKRQIPLLKKDNLIIEPAGRNTLPCITLGAVIARSRNPAAVMAVLPADHLIKPVSNFLSLLRQAAEFAQKEDAIVTVGIRPCYPATGYGYIKIATGNRQQATGFGDGIYKVERFIEKPPLEKAKRFYRNKSFFWNGGIFIAKASKLWEEIKKFMPAIYKEFACLENIDSRIKFNSALNQIYKNAPPISIDYAVLEKSKDIFMIKANFSWCDLGSWEALASVCKKDSNNNVNKGRNLLFKTRRSVVINEQNNHLIAAVGLSNVVVVHTPQATLIQDRSRSQELKNLVAKLEKDKRYRRYI